MLKKISFVAIFVALISIPMMTFSEGSDEKAKELFVKYKCNHCHTIDAASIAKDPNAKVRKLKVDPPDLSTVGEEHDAEWMAKYIKKKVKKEGLKHPKKFKGSDEERIVLTKWLAALKSSGDEVQADEKVEESTEAENK